VDGAGPDVAPLFDALFRHATNCVLFTRTDGTVLRANPAACKALARSEEEILREGRGGLVVPDASALRILEERTRTGVATGELTFRRPDGSTFAAEVTTTVLPRATDDEYAYVIFQDVTGLRRSEASARARDAQIRAYFDSPAVGVAVTSPGKGWLDVNDRVCSMLGYSREELSRLTWLEMTHPDDIAADVAEFNRLVSGESDSYSLDKRLIRKDGTVVWVLLSVSCARAPDGRVEYFVAILRDIGKRKEAEELLRASERRFRTMADGAPVLIWTAGPDKSCNWFSQPWLAFTGRTMAQEQGNGWAEGVHPDDLPGCLATYVDHFDRREPFTMEYRLRRHDGVFRWLIDSGSPLVNESGAFTGYIGSCIDITAHKESESALAASKEELRIQQERLDLAAKSGKLGLWDLDLVTDQAWRTPQHDRLFGYEELQPTWGYEICLRHVTPEDRPIFQRAFEEAYVTGRLSFELRIDPARGPQRWIAADGEVFRDQTGKPIRMMGTVLDVTESRGLQAQLAQAARLAAMGTLVAGVAHEINNPLAGELANQGLALEVVQDVRDRLLGSAPFDRVAEGRRLEEVVEALADAEAGGRRIARIVKDLTTFGRPDPRRTRVRLIEVVDESMRWLAATVTTTANLRVDDHSAPDVIASSGQIEQVLVNLVTNAAKAMPEGKRGEIVVRLGPGSPGMSRLEVIDQGTGMSRTVVDRIFDPFFTTRQVGQGTGLGLAISHAIVTAHGGTLTVQSEVGKGSAFRVELPVAGAEA
jgi:PAS domain S-box-containing protein